jgi:hypothetical protein
LLILAVPVWHAEFNVIFNLLPHLQTTSAQMSALGGFLHFFFATAAHVKACRFWDVLLAWQAQFMRHIF